ncbi:MAG: PDZ domain-containing protein [Gemmatimonadetes bacterium]|nr:PDZ domain-containing protein [Gemmatimonadota bacterium]MYG15311.1 PDZ domain-containing protein [Gemmatimonadota bacterium]
MAGCEDSDFRHLVYPLPTHPCSLPLKPLKTIGLRYFLLSTLVVALCAQMGLVVWTLVRFTQIEHWSPGIQFFGNEMIKTKGLTRSAVINLQEGTWFHLVRIREDGGIKVTQVDADSPADRAGLRPGDLVISIDGTDLRTRPEAYFQARLRSRPGDQFNLAWLRDGNKQNGILTLEGTEQVRYAVEVNQEKLVLGAGAMTWFQQGPYLIFPMVLLVFGSWIGFRRPGNKIAFQCALLFLATALSVSPAFHPMIAGWPDWILSLSILVITLANFLEFWLLLSILTVFPIETEFGSWMRKRAGWILIPFFAWIVIRIIYLLSLTNGWNSDLIQTIISLVESVPIPALPVLVVLIAASLLLAQRSVARRQQYTRLAFINVGFVSAFILAPVWTIIQPGTLMATWVMVPLQGALLPLLVWLLDHIVLVGLKCILPLSFAYSVLAHRVFGLRFIVGKSLRRFISNQGVNLLLSLGLLLIIYETITFWATGVEASDLLITVVTAGFILALVGGWTLAKPAVIRFIDQYLFRDEIENRQRLFRLRRELTHFQDRNALLNSTGSELLEVLDISYVAIYLSDGPRNPISVAWYDISKKFNSEPKKDEAFFSDTLGKIEALLKLMSPERPLVESGDPYLHNRVLDLGYELIILLRGELHTQGCIAIGAKVSEEPFTGEEKEQLLVLAAELEMVLKNIKATTSLRMQTQRLKRLSNRLINIQESERRRLASDLHNDTGQALTALKMSLEITRNELSGNTDHTAERLNDAVALADDTLEKLRAISHNLRPPTLDTVGLNSALEGLCNGFTQRTQMPVSYVGTDTSEISNPIDICLYRILQEGLTNCAKHGQASHVEVSLKRDGDAVQLSIKDNGKGFDLADTLSDQNETGIGLIDMQERLESLNGRMKVHSKPGAGARLVATIPLEVK